ncbi:FAD-binding oxidoreductase [soil metagenome]
MIGGGVIGTSIALHLVRKGVEDVLLLEAGKVGSGDTSKSGAIVRQHYFHPILLRWAQRALQTFHRFEEIYGIACGFVPAPYLMVCGPEDLTSLKNNVALGRETGVNTRVVSPEEIEELVPGINGEDLVAGAYEADAGYANATQTAEAFAEMARREGVNVVENCKAIRLKVQEDRISGVATELGDVSTDTVILASGLGALDLAAEVGVRLPIRAMKHEIVIFRRPEELAPQRPVVSDRVTGLVYRPDGPDGTRVGATDVNEGTWDVPPDDYEDAATPERVASYAERLTHRFPRFRNPRAVKTYAGLYHMTPDQQPILGSLGGIEGLYSATGFSHGFKLSPVVGDLMARCIVDGIEAAPELKLFSFERFEKEELIQPRFTYSKGYAG